MLNNLNNPRQYVRQWLTFNNVEVSGSGNLKKNDKEYSIKVMHTTLWLDYKQEVATQISLNSKLPKNEKIKVIEIRESDMKKATEELLTLEAEAARDAAAESIKTLAPEQGLSSPVSLPLVEKFIKAVKGSVSYLDVMVLAHWIWCVKRKSAGMPVSYHIMPVFYGRQEGGKSEAVKALCKPLIDFTQKMSLENLGDEKYNLALSKSLIVFFDEMAGAERADMQKLKHQITTDYNSTRLFHTQDVIKTEQACMFIGASNKHINELILDPTGMRRFYQIDCLDLLNWDDINDINYVELWQSVNEFRPKGYTREVEADLKASQAELTQKEDVELFAEAIGINISVGPFKNFELSDIYYTYKVWSHRAGAKTLSLPWFSKKLINKIKCNKIREWQDNKLLTLYELNASCHIEMDKETADEIARKFKK